MLKNQNLCSRQEGRENLRPERQRRINDDNEPGNSNDERNCEIVIEAVID